LGIAALQVNSTKTAAGAAVTNYQLPFANY